MTVSVAAFRERYPNVDLPEWLQAVDEVNVASPWAQESTRVLTLAMHYAMDRPAFCGDPDVTFVAWLLVDVWRTPARQAVEDDMD